MDNIDKNNTNISKMTNFDFLNNNIQLKYLII